MDRIRNFFSLENKIIFAVTLVAIFFAKFPTFYNWINTSPGLWYPKQSSFFDAWDINVYVSIIRYGQRAGILLQNTYTTLPHKGIFIYQYYTFLGILNRALHLDPFILFHLAGILTSIFLIIACYYVLKVFIKDFALRISAFIITILGGGFGWITYIHSLSADYTRAGFTMVNEFERGNSALTTMLVILTFTYIYQYVKSRKRKYLLYAAVASIICIFNHPPFAVMFLFISVVLSVWFYPKNKFHSLPYIGSLIVFMAFYSLYILANLITNPAFSGITRQNMPYADPFSFILGFGLLSIFIIYSLFFYRHTTDEIILLRLFFMTQLMFSFVYLGYRLHYMKGLYIWGVILAIYAINELFKNEKTRLKVLTLLVILSLISRFNTFNSLMHPNPNNAFFYLTNGEGRAIEQLSKLPADSGILSLYRLGNYIPAHTDLRVYYGHSMQTPNGIDTLERARLFYIGMSKEERAKFLKDNHISYIYYGLEEAFLRKNHNLTVYNPFPEFKIIYQNETSIIYVVNLPKVS